MTSNRFRYTHMAASALGVLALVAVAGSSTASTKADADQFHLLEATISDVQGAITRGEITTTQLVGLYLKRIKAYNGTCVKQPQGVLGAVTTIPNAGQINALSTINLRPAKRKAWKLDDRKARSMTDKVDADPAMPDALEVAAELDKKFRETGKLAGPLHGVVIAVKDQYDTVDMRTTSGADAFYANDRPPDDATFVKKLRDAGAIIIGKANMGEYAAGARSAFGGTFCNPYDTERSPGGSSGGSGSSVAANLSMCAIAEESGPSIRSPAKNNNVVGISPTQELVSRDGMIPASYMNDRVGPICRTVADTAKVLDVITGYDPKDPLTAFGVGKKPEVSYATFAKVEPLSGLRIGVVREYMDKKLFTDADAESIDIVDRAVGELRKLGAEVVDPGAGGALFQKCVDEFDLVPGLVAKPAPEGVSIRGLGAMQTTGDRKYVLNRYLKDRGDANIQSIDDLLTKSNFYQPAIGYQDKKASLAGRNREGTLDVQQRLQGRFALQQVGLQCMGKLNLDALTYPTGNIPAPKLGAPNEPTVNGRPANAWSLLGQQGFPTITVPAGFTSVVFDRVPDPTSPPPPSTGGDGADIPTATKLVGPVAAKLPVGIDFLGRPFTEPLLIRIAVAYEAATKHRTPPQGYGPVSGEP